MLEKEERKAKMANNNSSTISQFNFTRKYIDANDIIITGSSPTRFSQKEVRLI